MENPLCCCCLCFYISLRLSLSFHFSDCFDASPFLSFSPVSLCFSTSFCVYPFEDSEGGISPEKSRKNEALRSVAAKKLFSQDTNTITLKVLLQSSGSVCLTFQTVPTKVLRQTLLYLTFQKLPFNCPLVAALELPPKLWELLLLHSLWRVLSAQSEQGLSTLLQKTKENILQHECHFLQLMSINKLNYRFRK